jgi:hypothetical protein
VAFLSVYVPTYKRPVMLAKCLASIDAQTDKDLEIVLIRDEIGIGIDGMYADIQNHLDQVNGDYVFVLSDDNLITDSEFVSELKAIAQSYNPDVIVFKNKIIGTLPDIWNAAPQEGHIDLSCFAVKADIWKANADKWGKCYAGDYHFIRALWDQGHSFYWWDKTPIMAMRISRGAAE